MGRSARGRKRGRKVVGWGSRVRDEREDEKRGKKLLGGGGGRKCGDGKVGRVWEGKWVWV